MNEKYTESTNEHNKLVAIYEEEKKELDRIKATLGTSSSAYKMQSEHVQTLEKQVNKSTATQNANAQSMSNLRIQMNNATSDIKKTENEIKDLDKAMEEADKTTDELGRSTKDAGEQAEKSSKGFTVLKGVLANLGAEAVKVAVSGLKMLSGALINVGKQAVGNYKSYQQLVGGVETLFGESADKVQKYAEVSYKTAGISANQYMEQITSFSASLISSLGGDTAKASEYGNRAIIDMSDNANKMGTSMEMIQNAYQGFAKQNYTMLDNLKLGYGGTKTEMQRLIKDASQMTDVQKELGVTVDAGSMSFGNIVNAISVMQKKMGIAGTTTKEAGDTIEGSFNSMAGAWQNLLTGIASGQDISGLIKNLVDSIVTTAKNLVPTIQNTIKGMGELASGLLKEVVPLVIKEIPPLIEETLPILNDAIVSAVRSVMDVLPMVIDAINKMLPMVIETILSLLPELVDAGIEGVNAITKGIIEALPTLIGMLPEIIRDLIQTILKHLPEILALGNELMLTLIKGISEAIPELITYLPEIIETFVKVLVENLPLILNSGIEIMNALVEGIDTAIISLVNEIPNIISAIINGIVKALPKFMENGGQIVGSLVDGMASKLMSVTEMTKTIVKAIISAFINLPSQMFNWGKDMIQGLIDGIKSMIGSVGKAVSKVADKIKSFLHFSRPDVGPLRDYETYMPDMIEGMAKSLENASPQLIDQVRNLAGNISDAMTTGSQYAFTGSSDTISYNSMVEAFKEALSQMKIELDDEVAGRFVRDTVTKAIYT